MNGFLIAAPGSGSGKTTVTLGLLRALKKRGLAVAPGKAGPDYIDPAFHAAASGQICLNFDPWAMRGALLRANAAHHASGDRLLIVEAMMGLFDGAADGSGSPADLAALLGLNVVLVVDCAKTSHSVAALVSGFAGFRPDTEVVGVILNRVGSDRHEVMLRAALDGIAMPVFGVIRSDPSLHLPERHLGLVQAGEHGELEAFIERASLAVEQGCDLDALLALSRGTRPDAVDGAVPPLPPIGQRIAVARDIAFAFSYAHVLRGWQAAGAELSFFSPLADEVPSAHADAVYLPGGYPELHAGRIAAAGAFRNGMLDAHVRGARIFGECGGYMVLGDALIDAESAVHPMLGLLPLVTSYAARKRHLGYRRIRPVDGTFFSRPMTAHEFHYASIVSEGAADRLFVAQDAVGSSLGVVGLRRGNVAGSFMHLIDIQDDAV
ncbi:MULTISPECIES: cobyrinate a,c-diamide synthase [Alphaproteobacteria]|uniref:Hydrogenobyrinate a,c-diamide synthase n=2 Tax=Alphaproteobacteria TaxID=28211 RepID=A0A512HHU4_9HYPH|nr:MULTISPECIES: cobyrinate a,c-diamide synthase [Alphaproteobacteria]GEO85018.1 hydrogenobyrinate a,c-diamide synthase [Ciceribacter naphthalenivorans]GLR22952.1 hydrogenobyrinate a,c-diamide synthase [Ciceribacter naphthalenivorans]GLT05808.1 hydrogenobyrinate a,c-diamide synthase [Sphingomonas psychrolutea]